MLCRGVGGAQASAAVELKKANAAQELECGNGQVGVGPGTYGAGNFSVKLNEALDESNPDPCATLIGPSRLTTLLWDIVGWPATWKYRNSLVLYRFKWYNETDYTVTIDLDFQLFTITRVGQLPAAGRKNTQYNAPASNEHITQMQLALVSVKKSDWARGEWFANVTDEQKCLYALAPSSVVIKCGVAVQGSGVLLGKTE